MSDFAPSKEKEAAITAILASESFVLVTETKVYAKEDEEKHIAYVNWELYSSDDGKMKLGGMLNFGVQLWNKNMTANNSDDSNKYY